MLGFDETVAKFPSIQRYPGGASTDLIPNLQQTDNPAPLLKNLPPEALPTLGGG